MLKKTRMKECFKFLFLKETLLYANFSGQQTGKVDPLVSPFLWTNLSERFKNNLFCGKTIFNNWY